MGGLRLALSWFSVAPIQVSSVDARIARRAVTWSPLVGALVGGVAAAVLAGLTSLGAAPLLAGLLTVAALVLLTRGMHVDGLADTVDGLGCYGPPERALAVMRDGGAGPFAVVALILVLGVQAVSLAELAAHGRWLSVVLACAVGRAGFVLCCHRAFPAARPEGMGALVAGAQRTTTVALWWVGLAALSGALLRPWWLGPVGVLLTGGLLVLLSRHVRRRFGGTTGDVLGAASELATTTMLLISTLATH